MSFTPSLNEMLVSIPARQSWLHFHNPLTILIANRVEEVQDVLNEVERQVSLHGRWAAGFLAYEAAPALDSALTVRESDERFPLAWFGIYPLPVELRPSQIFGDDFRFLRDIDWLPTNDIIGYTHFINKIKSHIAQGDTYQVNFTYRLRAECKLVESMPDAWPVFASLASFSPVPYAAFLETDNWAISSLSPELFFTLNGETITSRPMKGTAPRGRTTIEDQSIAAWLQASEKNRAENLMILDMVRNDMGRVARTGSVRVPHLFTVEKYPTVWQMTSTVQAETSATLPDIFKNLFPAASITGAPKVRTMQIIADLETTPRLLYTGSIGFYAPDRTAQFNVAIRTLLIDKARRKMEFGVGGGIVWDSQPEEEWQETITKARILREPPRRFELLETMRWTPGEGLFLLEEHIGRLSDSASYFSFPFNRQSLIDALSLIEQQAQGTPQRVRLRLARDGQILTEAYPLALAKNPTRITLARSPVQSTDRFLYHKTTFRERYQQALSECPGYEDILLWNERGEVTESTIANIVVNLDGEMATPPIEAGLLPGTYRAWMLKDGQVTERIIRIADLPRCSAIYLVNSVRGMWQVTVEGIFDPHQQG